MEIVRCRARVSRECYEGRPVGEVYPGERDMRADGTFQSKTNTVVCDACYLAIMPFSASGRGEHREIPRAIHHKRAQLLGPQLIDAGQRADWTDEQFNGLAYAIALNDSERPERVTSDQVEVTQFELDAGDIVADFRQGLIKITTDGMITKEKRFGER